MYKNVTPTDDAPTYMYPWTFSNYMLETTTQIYVLNPMNDPPRVLKFVLSLKWESFGEMFLPPQVEGSIKFLLR